MIELLQLAVETAVKEYAAYQYASGLTELFCCTGLIAILCATWYKAFQWIDEVGGKAVVSILAFIGLFVLASIIQDGATKVLAPKGAVIHELIGAIK